MLSGTVAIVGRPNVGKSTLFNRLLGERQSIVSDQPGVTRDRLYGIAHWLTKEFRIIDTGGIELELRPFQEQIRMQAEIAITEADVIVFVCDGQTGVTEDDRYVARLLQRSKKPIILAVNKVDDGYHQPIIYDFYALGLGDPIAVSTLHGIGTGDVLDAVLPLLPDRQEEVESDDIKFCLIGRPNVGKSSLINAILHQERVIVSEIEGTTRDAIDTPFEREGKHYLAIDTAGLKKRGRIYEAVDKYAALRALRAIDRSDVVALVIDGEVGIREQDKNVGGYAIDAGKAIVLVVNKWDAVVKDEHTMHQFSENIRKEFKFLDYAPIVYVSAKNQTRIPTLFTAINLAYENTTRRIQTSVLNGVILDAQQRNPAPDFNGGRLKIRYANQVAIKPPAFVLFVNNHDYLHFSYRRYLENTLRDAFGFEGTPLHFIPRMSE